MEAVMRGTAAYGYAKERSGGPLRSGILTLEETVKSTIGPVYDKFHLVPDELIRKVDESITVVRSVVPVAARTTVSEMAKTVYSTYEPTARMLYSRYQPKAEQCAVSAWQRLIGLPLVPRVADVVLPKVVYCTEKYNETVAAAAEKGYRVSEYLPLVPTEKIAKVFSQKEKKGE
ncbi:hypothetical protein RIF29_35922 [Crotalaria pallida]|uniref:Stress-related protein n=1 Tax=Crotalaria pallida TaxID=3830 RepID=A0AAN9EAU2_CROPI